MSAIPRPTSAVSQSKDNDAPVASKAVSVRRRVDLLGRALRAPVVPLLLKGKSNKAEPVVSSGASGILFKSFIFAVILPTICAALYYSFIASPIYITEAKITVRQAPQDGNSGGLASAASSILGKIGLNKLEDTSQNTLMVLDYIKSQAVIADIGGKELMQRVYARPYIDWLSRLDGQDSLAEMQTYWKRRVSASVDTSSNILTMRVRAYQAEDSLMLAKEIIANSEALINSISDRSRKDALGRAESQVQVASAELADVRSQMLTFRQFTGSMDPVETAKQILELKSALILQKIELENKLTTAANSGVSGRPGDRYIESQISAVDSQISALDNLLFSKEDQNSISSQLKGYELLKLKEEFASENYMLARASYEDARRKLERQQLYLVTIVPPLLPEVSLSPKVFIDTILVALGCAVLWAIAALLVASVRDSSQL